MKILMIISVAFLLISCAEEETPEDNPSVRDTAEYSCENLFEEEGYMDLTGTLVITAEGEYIFKALSDDTMNIACPTFLVACDEGLKEYVNGAYMGFASVRNIDDSFWITISGRYLNLDHYHHQDESFEQLEFIFDFVGLVDSPFWDTLNNPITPVKLK
jgi:hypothetical protein